jgi:hypothetical protein
MKSVRPNPDDLLCYPFYPITGPETWLKEVGWSVTVSETTQRVTGSLGHKLIRHPNAEIPR